MGKKKRKSGASETKTPTKQLEQQSQEPEDWLELRLLGSTKGKATDAPQISITKEDAYRLDILNDDSVLVLVQNNEGILEQSCVCSARIAAQDIIPGSPSLRSPSSTNRLAKGSCHIVPPSLLGRLCGQQSVKEEGDVEVHTPSGTPSKGFSFARGGGGDAMIASPKTPSKTPTKATSKLPGRTIWIVPLYNSLGTRLIRALSKPCSSLRVKPTVEVPSNSLKVVEALLSARISDRYIVNSESITISFQGKPLGLSVSLMDAQTEDSLDSIEQAMDQLTLDEQEAEDDGLLTIVEAVEDVLDDPIKRASLLLFHVGRDTALEIESQETKSNDVLKGPFVAGLDDFIQQVKSIAIPTLLEPHTYYGDLKPPRGALLFGSGGVGKTALARQVAADVKRDHAEIDVDFVHCASLQSHTSVVGEAERRLSKLFDRSNKTLLILDDIHFICPKRGNNNPGIDRLAATLLALLDGVDANQNVYLLATTENPSLLDAALRRPGRLDEEVEIPIPDEKTRSKIWKFHLDTLRSQAVVMVDQFSDDDLSNLATLAKGFNGADCLLAVKEATRMAILTNIRPPHISLQLLKSAIGVTKPSTISSITVEVPRVFWTSIGGMEDVKEKLREAIELPLLHADLFAKFNIPPPRGVLLYGPPGCSKTLMARALATEGKMNFLAVKGPELLSKWLGESERALASLFRRARMASPCIIFFDEVDAIASQRGSSGGDAGGERLLSQLLTELDGVGTARNKSHVVVVAATNRPDLLDHALTRPGRIDRKIYVGLPDRESRERIFEIGLKKKAHSDDIDVRLNNTLKLVRYHSRI